VKAGVTVAIVVISLRVLVITEASFANRGMRGVAKAMEMLGSILVVLIAFKALAFGTDRD
jgi:hypothetical protein